MNIPTTAQMDRVDSVPFLLMALCYTCKKWTTFEDSDENRDIFILKNCECGGKLQQSSLISQRSFKA